MKRMKSGFTLAEVLITLGIIGVVAAIVMPSVVSSYQYKTVGVKLSKFASQVEGAARPFVVNNGNFEAITNAASNNDRPVANLQAFIQESFLATNTNVLEVDGVFDGVTDAAPSDQHFTGASGTTNKPMQPHTNGTAPVINLKDGTQIMVYALNNYVVNETTAPLGSRFNARQVGDGMFAIRFAPRVQGLPRNAQQTYDFIVTELGFVYPHQGDTCLAAIVNADYVTNARTYAQAACSNAGNAAATTPDTGSGSESESGGS